VIFLGVLAENLRVLALYP